MAEIKINELNIFDKEEIYPNCTVQILTNTITGEQSIGWWINDDNESEELNEYECST